MGSYFFRVCVCSVAQSCPSSAIPWTVAHQIPPSMEFSREEYWSSLPFPSPGNLSDPVVELMSVASPALAGKFFTTAPPGKPISSIVHLHSILTSLLTLFLVVQWVSLWAPNAEGTSSIPTGVQVRELRSQDKKNYYFFLLNFHFVGQFHLSIIHFWKKCNNFIPGRQRGNTATDFAVCVNGIANAQWSIPDRLWRK